ncbi:DNA polymerase iota [Brachyhypopomus gauderio]|uniref:DNA polymerase iota n=1 Tax=Brachyhypopomus gauderio TaxID=698409 RepID=UPI0040415E27
MDTDEEGENDCDISADLLDVSGCSAADHRVVLHFDLDCYYAQVEMIRNPALRTKPLGVQQKYIIVTCNYLARELGVTKLMLVKDALEKCPNLVIVKGEDLTCYREMSYQVTELLMSYCHLVERLGFDENFVDATEMVENRIKDTDMSSLSFVGHVYKHDASAVDVQEHARLALGSVIASELREALHSKLGLTSCAGIASNKLLAKLISGTFKPNQQTALLPQSTAELMSSLSGPGKVPGIGYRTAEKLKALGVMSIPALQGAPLHQLVREFGDATAKRIQSLAYGTDPSPVTPAGPPQSLSDEDSFRKISTVMEVESKVRELLSCLTERMQKDGRLPQTLRLTLRRSTAVNRWFCRESRQCPIPHHTARRVLTGGTEAVPELVSMVMRLFHRLVDVGEGFHLTLLNVCFTNLQNKSTGRNAISSYFTHTPLRAAHTSTQAQETVGAVSTPDTPLSHTQTGAMCGVNNTQITELLQHTPLSSSLSSPSSSSLRQTSLSQAVQAESPVSPLQPVLEHSDEKRVDTGDSRPASVLEKRKSSDLPPHIDPDVFRELPEHIQKELLASFWTAGSVPGDSTGAQGSAYTQHFTERVTAHLNQQGVSQCGESSVSHTDMAHNDDFSTGHAQNELCGEGQRSKEELSAGCPVTQVGHPDVPTNVDPRIFSELPPDVQAELLADWKQRKPMLKVPSKLASKHAVARGGRPAPKGSQSNSLLKYFKPS